MRLFTRIVCVGLSLLACAPVAAGAAARAIDVTTVVAKPKPFWAGQPATVRSREAFHPLAAQPSAALLDPPANDQCAGAITIPCGNISLSDDTFLATNDYDFVDTTTSCTKHFAAGHDVVYKFNAVAGDSVWLDFQSLADASIYIVTNCANVQASCVAGADEGLQGEVEHLRYGFPSTGTYYLILDSWSPGSYGAWTLVGQFISCGMFPPANDRCPTATLLFCGQGAYSGSTQTAFNDYFFPSLGASCATNSLAGGRDVAFKLNITAGDSIYVTYTSTANAVAYILQDCGNMASCVTGVNATGVGGLETIAHRFVFSGTYYLILDSDGAESFGSWSMTSTLTCVNAPPANDLCSGATTIACGAINLSGTTKYANNDYSLGVNGCTGTTPVGPDVVYKINAAPGDSLALQFGFPDNIQPSHQDGPDGVVYLVMNCNDPTNSCVAGEDDTGFGQLETLNYKFKYGTTYYLIFDSYDPTPGGNWIAGGQLICAGVTGVENGQAADFRLGAPTPNPFARTSTVHFSLASRGRVMLKIYDLTGRVVRTLVDGDLAAGEHSATWDARNDAGVPVRVGTYYARLVNGDRIAHRTLIFIR